jgi:hypothetical protein
MIAYLCNIVLGIYSASFHHLWTERYSRVSLLLWLFVTIDPYQPTDSQDHHWTLYASRSNQEHTGQKQEGVSFGRRALGGVWQHSAEAIRLMGWSMWEMYHNRWISVHPRTQPLRCLATQTHRVPYWLDYLNLKRRPPPGGKSAGDRSKMDSIILPLDLSSDHPIETRKGYLWIEVKIKRWKIIVEEQLKDQKSWGCESSQLEKTHLGWTLKSSIKSQNSEVCL